MYLLIYTKKTIKKTLIILSHRIFIILFYIIKRLLFSFIFIHFQPRIQNSNGIFMDSTKIAFCIKIIKRDTRIKAISLIYFSCSYPITKSFFYIFYRHLYRTIFSINLIIPIFIMMLIPSLMVQPSRRISKLFSFKHIWTPKSLKIFYSYKEFSWRIFR